MQSKFASKLSFITVNFVCKDCKVFIGTSCITTGPLQARLQLGQYKRLLELAHIKWLDLAQVQQMRRAFLSTNWLVSSLLRHGCRCWWFQQTWQASILMSLKWPKINASWLGLHVHDPVKLQTCKWCDSAHQQLIFRLNIGKLNFFCLVLFCFLVVTHSLFTQIPLFF